MTSPATSLLNLLDLEQQSELEFVGRPSNEPHVRSFGGQVAAQALMAAGRTVAKGRLPHSLHSYFIRPGAPDQTTVFRTQVIRNGRSFGSRRVEALQNDKMIFELNASFHIEESGVSHSDAAPLAPDPEHLVPFETRFAGREETDMARWFIRARPFDIRYIQHSPFDFAEVGSEAVQRLWIRFREELPLDPLLHCALFTYISDMTVLDAILLRHGIRWTDEAVLGASLDHSIWFHRPFRMDEWLLIDQASPIAAGGRGLAQGKVWTRDGRLVTTFTQEALLRPPFVG